MTATSLCRNCGTSRVQVLLDFGAQPPSNRFLREADASTDEHPLVIGHCSRCALVQLVSPMSPEMVKSRFEWLTYNEPEGHLDDLVARLTGLDGISRGSVIGGLTYKDDSTLARFNRMGYDRTFRYDLHEDFGIADRCAGLETLQGVVNEAVAARLNSLHGRADLLVARHVLEHAHDPGRFLRALGRMVKPGGYLVFEMPDCTKFLSACDYSFVWEEHITYFSPATVKSFAESQRFPVADLLSYEYPLEDSLVAIMKIGGVAPGASRPSLAAEHELKIGREFGRQFAGIRSGIRARLRNLRSSGKRIAVFGAGHLAAKFINLLSLREFVDCVVDDNPNKQELCMPGSRLAIVGSSALVERKIDLCLLSLSPESEQKVLAKKQDYVAGGGKFVSIFALSPIALRPE